MSATGPGPGGREGGRAAPPGAHTRWPGPPRRDPRGQSCPFPSPEAPGPSVYRDAAPSLLPVTWACGEPAFYGPKLSEKVGEPQWPGLPGWSRGSRCWRGQPTPRGLRGRWGPALSLTSLHARFPLPTCGRHPSRPRAPGGPGFPSFRPAQAQHLPRGRKRRAQPCEARPPGSPAGHLCGHVAPTGGPTGGGARQLLGAGPAQGAGPPT